MIQLVRRFAVENMLTEKVEYHCTTLPYDPLIEQADLSSVLEQICQAGIPIWSTRIFFVDSHKKMNFFVGQFPGKRIYLTKQNVSCQVIKISYTPLDNESRPSKLPNSKPRIKERTIRQAVEGVRQWLKLYKIENQNEAEIHTLESASKVVGIAKKTLSDYYKHIRLADEYGFDFEIHQNDKVGILRRFIRARNFNVRHTEKQKESDPDSFWSFFNT